MKADNYAGMVSMISLFRNKYGQYPKYETVIEMVILSQGVGRETAESYLKDLVNIDRLRIDGYRRVNVVLEKELPKAENYDFLKKKIIEDLKKRGR